MNRRNFVKSAIAASALINRRAAPAGDKVNLAVIGVRSRGKSLASSFAALPDVNIAYLCDVDERTLGAAATAVEERAGKRPQLISDLRRALDDKAIDAVVIAAPDHWHAPATILACDAGKDVYVEKPCSQGARRGGANGSHGDGPENLLPGRSANARHNEHYLQLRGQDAHLRDENLEPLCDGRRR